MVLQLVGLLGIVGLLCLRERRLYNQAQQSRREQARQERDVRARLRTRTTDVTTSTVQPPASVHPIEWAPSRRLNRRGDAA